MGILCQRCKQANATVHLTDIPQDGPPTEHHLCEMCASQEGIAVQSPEPLSTLEKFVKMGAGLQEATRRKCPECGMSFGEFRAEGLLGCPHDYEVFGDLLLPLIERAHGGGLQHVGKIPGQTGAMGARRARIMRIRREMETAVAEENYEQAARLRDELKFLEAEDADEH